LSKLKLPSVQDAVFLPDGRLAAVTKTELYFLTPENNTIEKPVILSENEIRAKLYLLYDKVTLVIGVSPWHGVGKSEVILYNIQTNTRQMLPISEGRLDVLINLPIHERFLMGFANSTIYACKLNGEQVELEETIYCNHSNTSPSLTVSPDEKYICWYKRVNDTPLAYYLVYLTEGIDKNYWLLEYNQDHPHLFQSLSIAISPDHKTLLISGDTTVFWNLDTLQPVREIKKYGTILWHPVKNYFVLSGITDTDATDRTKNNSFAFYTAAGEWIADYKSEAGIRKMLFTKEGDRLILLTGHGRVHIYKTNE